MRPWFIDSVFLFEREPLLATLAAHGVKIGIATSIRKADWNRPGYFGHHTAAAALHIPARPAGAVLLTHDPRPVDSAQRGYC